MIRGRFYRVDSAKPDVHDGSARDNRDQGSLFGRSKGLMAFQDPVFEYEKYHFPVLLVQNRRERQVSGKLYGRGVGQGVVLR